MKKKLFVSVVSLAMMTAVLFTGCGNSDTEASAGTQGAGTITLSVNPQIQIAYDEEGKVIGLTGANDDGEKIIEAYPDYVGKECDDVVEGLLEEIYEAGYFDVKIDGKVKAIVIQLEPGSKLPYEEFLQELRDECDYTADSLKLTSDVFLIDDDDYDQKYTTTEQTSHYITLKKAKQIALAFANVKAANAVFEEREFDFDDGNAVYELEFRANGYRYEYNIDALTGRVLSAEHSKIKKTTNKNNSGTNSGTGGSASYGNTDYGNTNYGNTNYGNRNSGNGSGNVSTGNGGSNTNYSNYNNGNNTNYSNYNDNTNYGNSSYDDGNSGYDDGNSDYDD